MSYITFLFAGFVLVYYEISSLWGVNCWSNGVKMDDDLVGLIFAQYLKCTPEQKQIIDEEIYQVFLDKTHGNEEPSSTSDI